MLQTYNKNALEKNLNIGVKSCIFIFGSIKDPEGYSSENGEIRVEGLTQLAALAP
jgi:hypothetical protein|tara:strand:- start:3045 stop:3209 length:165 start_codon:yes stop_codon:yes gene_type:complete